jgi:putative Holliday junction resolvase
MAICKTDKSIVQDLNLDFSTYRNYKTFQGKTILAIDYGTKVTGLATYCVGREPFPSPFGRLIYKSDEKLIIDLKPIIDDEVIEVLVLGIPHLLDGTETEMTKKIKAFGEELKAAYPDLEVIFQDETLSSYAAEERMKSSPRYNFKVDLKEIDSVAATIILEDFIRQE